MGSTFSFMSVGLTFACLSVWDFQKIFGSLTADRSRREKFTKNQKNERDSTKCYYLPQKLRKMMTARVGDGDRDRDGATESEGETKVETEGQRY